MRKFVLFIMLYLMTATAFAATCGLNGTNPNDPSCTNILPDPDVTAPEPEVLALLAIGALGFVVARRIKK